MIALFGEVNTLVTNAEKKAAREFVDPATGIRGRVEVAETQRKLHIQHVGTAATLQVRIDNITGQRVAEIIGAVLAECQDATKAKDLLARWKVALQQVHRPTLQDTLAEDEAVRVAEAEARVLLGIMDSAPSGVEVQVKADTPVAAPVK